jgi:F-type H+-transporting ATPase subunit gamma
MDTLENLHGKIDSTVELKSVVKTMKAMAASKIGQYEIATNSLKDYYNTVVLALNACLKEEKIESVPKDQKVNTEKTICAVVFGSDQGLVGQFNDTLSNFVSQSLKDIRGKKEIWPVGERAQLLLADMGFKTDKSFSVPNSVSAITSLVEQILVQSEKEFEKGDINEFHIFHNQQKQGNNYLPVHEILLPLNKEWSHEISKQIWPTKKMPQIIGENKTVIKTLIHEYLFVSLFKACAESLASENASRLSAMQRAEKNIEELLDDLNSKFHRLRQSSIDEELFDVISGFEALKNTTKTKHI